MIKYKEEDKVKVLAALYNAVKLQGLGHLHMRVNMSIEDAQDILDIGQSCLDYFYDRVMKVDFATCEFDPWLYDRDNGQGTAAKALGLANIPFDEIK